MKLTLRIIRYVLTWPSFLGYLFPLVMVGVFAARELRFEDNAVLAATWRPWVTKFWKYSTTLSRGMVFQPGASDRMLAHEQVHVRQVEDRLVLALLISIIWAVADGNGLESWALHLAVWSSGILWQVPNFLMALLRGGHVYRDAEHERSAYAQTDLIGRGEDRSWLDEHLSKPRSW